MQLKTIHAVFISPTGTSKSIVTEIAANLAGKEGHFVRHDLTHASKESVVLQADKDDFVIIGVPVYAGRVAQMAKNRLHSVRGDNTPAAIVVLYGNREFDDALLELYDIARLQSLRVVAAAAFIGEHSFSTPEAPIGAGRPDDKDLFIAGSFAREILKNLDQRKTAYYPREKIPGNDPFTEGLPKGLPFTPYVDLSMCTQCGICVSSCPGDAIEITTELTIIVSRCIHCCCCIKICPENAVSLSAPPLLEKRQWLSENYNKRKEPQLFLEK
jgi:ferredoxin